MWSHEVLYQLCSNLTLPVTDTHYDRVDVHASVAPADWTSGPLEKRVDKLSEGAHPEFRSGPTTWTFQEQRLRTLHEANALHS